jgi:hypothetical protein
MCQIEVIGKIKTYFIVNNFLSENRPIYEILVMWENMVELDNPQPKIRRKHFAYWINKDRDIHSEYVILISVPRQQSFLERAPVFRFHVHVYFLFCCALSHGTHKYIL